MSESPYASPSGTLDVDLMYVAVGDYQPPGESHPDGYLLMEWPSRVPKTSDYPSFGRSWRPRGGPGFQSEARGWLARVHYLRGDYSSAAKIYLDELRRNDSIFTRESLITSLRVLFPYNGSSSRMADHLDEYFDSPAHALFAVTIATNPVYFDSDERASMAETARKAIEELQKRGDLFRQGGESEALALALMRAAVYMGDTRAALSYSKLVPEQSDAANDPDFNWMVAACCFLQKDYGAAEAPLLRMYHSPKADSRHRSAAAQGLIGIYLKLGRGVDQLYAAFLAEQAGGNCEQQYADMPYDGYTNGFMHWPVGNTTHDLAYLLDLQLTDGDLLDFLEKYAFPARSIVVKYGILRCRSTSFEYCTRERSAYDVVQYALAVRYARQESYDKAARIFEKIQSWPRAKRARKLSRLYAMAANPKLSSRERLEAQYAYAAYLEEHSTQVFFNDMFWHGFQTLTFLGNGVDFPYGNERFPTATDVQGLTKEERQLFLARERKIKDEQEERWRAYLVLAAVVEKAGISELGKRAANRALRCLRLINTDRFGRKDEIDSAFMRMTEKSKGGRQPQKDKRARI